MLVALSLVIQVSIMAKGLLMSMLTLMPMLTTVCMDTEDMDTGIQVAIPMWLVLPTTVL